MITSMRLLTIALVLLIAVPQFVGANELQIRPFLIDATMVPRESVTETITVTNQYDTRKAVVYATVNEITVGTNGEIKEFISPVMTDRTNTITSWIEISRARIEIDPGDTAEIPLSIKVHPYAEPGEYHVFIGFVETNKRQRAEEIALAGDADGVLVKVTVGDERTDSMRIVSTVVDKVVSRDTEQQVEITVENAGDIASAPQGELIYYDTKGQEVVAVPINESARMVTPGQRETFIVSIPFGNSVGRYKANVNLAYGANQRANLYDTTSFFVLPLEYLLLLASFLLLLLIVLFILIRRSQAVYDTPEVGDSVSMYIRDGHQANPKDHDIDLTK